MPDAAYYRAQAKLCEELGRHLTSAEDARVAFTAAARHLVRAEEVEDRKLLESNTPPNSH
jgi:hypothetical protein